MIPRYALPEMLAIFSDTARFGRYLEIELLATEAHAALGNLARHLVMELVENVLNRRQ